MRRANYWQNIFKNMNMTSSNLYLSFYCQVCIGLPYLSGNFIEHTHMKMHSAGPVKLHFPKTFPLLSTKVNLNQAAPTSATPLWQSHAISAQFATKSVKILLWLEHNAAYSEIIASHIFAFSDLQRLGHILLIEAGSN